MSLARILKTDHKQLAVKSCYQLKAAREKRGMSLRDLSERTGMDRSALSKLESGERLNLTIATLMRYADAMGMRLELSLTDVP